MSDIRFHNHSEEVVRQHNKCSKPAPWFSIPTAKLQQWKDEEVSDLLVG